MKETPDLMKANDINTVYKTLKRTIIIAALVSNTIAGTPPTETKNIKTKNIQPSTTTKKSEKNNSTKNRKSKNPTSPKSAPAGSPLDSIIDPLDPILADTPHKTINNS